MNVDIGRDTLLALVAVAWADGEVSEREKAGLRAAAQQLGLGAEDRAELERALGAPRGLDEVETVRMPRLTRLFTYAAASWIAGLDGPLDPREEATLGVLGDRLGLSAKARSRAREVASSLVGAAPGDPYDVLALRARLAAGLSHIGDD